MACPRDGPQLLTLGKLQILVLVASGEAPTGSPREGDRWPVVAVVQANETTCTKDTENQDRWY